MGQHCQQCYLFSPAALCVTCTVCNGPTLSAVLPVPCTVCNGPTLSAVLHVQPSSAMCNLHCVQWANIVSSVTCSAQQHYVKLALCAMGQHCQQCYLFSPAALCVTCTVCNKPTLSAVLPVQPSSAMRKLHCVQWANIVSSVTCSAQQHYV